MPVLAPGKVFIDLRDLAPRYLENFLPESPSEFANFLCLPLCDETEDACRQRAAIMTGYACDNAVTIADERRLEWFYNYYRPDFTQDSETRFSKQTSAATHNHAKLPRIYIDLDLINEGIVYGSHRWANIFFINQIGNTQLIGGVNTYNSFLLCNPEFSGFIQGGVGREARNVLDLTQSPVDLVCFIDQYLFSFIDISEENYLHLTNQFMEDSSQFSRDYNNLTVSLDHINYFVGREEKADFVDCQAMPYELMIDTQGSALRERPDKIKGCRTAIVHGNMEVSGNLSQVAYYYINPSEGYTSFQITAPSVYLFFYKTAILLETKTILYFPYDNKLRIIIEMGAWYRTFTLDLYFYFNDEQDTQYILIDKYQSEIKTQILQDLDPIVSVSDSDANVPVTLFNLYSESDLTDLAKLVAWYQTISDKQSRYRVFGIIEAKIEHASNSSLYVFGTSEPDAIIFNQNIAFASAGDGNDVHQLDLNTLSNQSYTTIIDNYAADGALDALLLGVSMEDIFLEKEAENLVITYLSEFSDDNYNITFSVQSYFHGSDYQHLILQNQTGIAWIPFLRPQQQSYDKQAIHLVPYYTVSEREPIIFLTAAQIDTTPIIALETSLDKLLVYRLQQDLLLLEKLPPESQEVLVFTLRLKDFFLDSALWSFVNFYLCQDSYLLTYRELTQLFDLIIDYGTEIKAVYKSLIQSYLIDLAENSTNNIYHNQELLALNQTRPIDFHASRVGIIEILFFPKKIIVSSVETDLQLYFPELNSYLLLKNWDSESCRINRLNFLGTSIVSVKDIDSFSLSRYYKIQLLINEALFSPIIDKKLAGFDGEVLNAIFVLIASQGLLDKQDYLPECIQLDSMGQVYEFVEHYALRYSTDFLKNLLREKSLEEFVNGMVWLALKAYVQEVPDQAIFHCFYPLKQEHLYTILAMFSMNLWDSAEKAQLATEKAIEEHMPALMQDMCERLNLLCPQNITVSQRRRRRTVETKFLPLTDGDEPLIAVVSRANRLQSAMHWFWQGCGHVSSLGQSLYHWAAGENLAAFSVTEEQSAHYEKNPDLLTNCQPWDWQACLQLLTVILFKWRGFQYPCFSTDSVLNQTQALGQATSLLESFQLFLSETISSKAVLNLLLAQEDIFIALLAELTKKLMQGSAIDVNQYFSLTLKLLLERAELDEAVDKIQNLNEEISFAPEAVNLLKSERAVPSLAINKNFYGSALFFKNRGGSVRASNDEFALQKVIGTDLSNEVNTSFKK